MEFHSVFISFRLFFLSARDWTQGLVLARQAHYHLSLSTSPLCVGYFWDRVLLFAHSGLNCDPPVCAHPCSQDDRYGPLHPPIDWDETLWTFCPGWPGTKALSFSGSLIAWGGQVYATVPAIGWDGFLWNFCPG
jgi:hypothetical protein